LPPECPPDLTPPCLGLPAFAEIGSNAAKKSAAAQSNKGRGLHLLFLSSAMTRPPQYGRA
jgi:hypothetical protein